jgi:hypothetical protein
VGLNLADSQFDLGWVALLGEQNCAQLVGNSL